MKKRIFIVWGGEMQLSNNLGQALGAEVIQVYYKKIGPYNLPAMVRYIFQAAETLLILMEHGPEAVIVQNPPVFAPLVVLLYCKLSGARLVIDSHTAAFLDEKWVNFHGLFKFAARRAALNTCHNYKNLEILKSWGLEPIMVMQFFNPEYDLEKISRPLANENLEAALAKSKLPVMMVNRFAGDDDWETVLKTAGLTPEADFFITGDPAAAALKAEKLPSNVILTGYLKHNEFLKLMRRARVVLTFSLRPDTVLWSIREIMALNKPFVTTDSEVLRHYYGAIGLFVKPGAPEKLKEKILEAVEGENDLRQKIKIFLEQDEKRWQLETEKFKSYL